MRNHFSRLFMFALLLLAAPAFGAASSAQSLTTVTGTIYRGDGSRAAGVRLRINKAVKANVVVSNALTYTPPSNSMGFISFTVLRDSQTTIEGPAAGFDRSGGCIVNIPDAATVAIETFVCVATPLPASGLTVKSDDAALIAKYAAIDFSPSFGVAASPAGEANVSLKPAAAGLLGGVKVGAGLSVTADGTLSAAGGGVTDHGALSGLGDDDHPQYQLRSGLNAADGYAGLDASALLPDNRLPASIARDSEVAAAVGAHASDASNPHNVTKTQVGLSSVDNTSDADKPVSTAQAAALDLKAAKAANLSDLASAATARTNLGLAIGTNVQAWDADLDAWATKTPPTGAVVGTSDSQALTNKTLALGSNTVSGTLAQFNTAVTDADLARTNDTNTFAGVQTFSSAPVVGSSGVLIKFGGTTSSFPGLRNSGSRLELVDATNSSFAIFKMASLDISGLSQILHGGSDGTINLLNSTSNGFDRLMFGGTTTSFPALKRNGVNLETKLANDSAYTGHVASKFCYSGTTVCDFAGAGTPEGSITASVGSTYRNTTDGSFYRKTSGTGNTGWVTP